MLRLSTYFLLAFVYLTSCVVDNKNDDIKYQSVNETELVEINPVSYILLEVVSTFINNRYDSSFTTTRSISVDFFNENKFSRIPNQDSVVIISALNCNRNLTECIGVFEYDNFFIVFFDNENIGGNFYEKNLLNTILIDSLACIDEKYIVIRLYVIKNGELNEWFRTNYI